MYGKTVHAELFFARAASGVRESVIRGELPGMTCAGERREKGCQVACRNGCQSPRRKYLSNEVRSTIIDSGQIAI